MTADGSLHKTKPFSKQLIIFRSTDEGLEHFQSTGPFLNKSER